MSFEAICSELERITYCTYISYALEFNNVKRIHYYSDKNWHSVFVKEKMIEECPLMSFGRQHRNATMLNWRDLAPGMNKRQRRVMDARAAHNIGNGLCLQQRVYGMREIITFASDMQYFDFPQEVFSNLSFYKPFVLQFRTIALASMLAQGWLRSRHDILKYFNNINNIADTVH